MNRYLLAGAWVVVQVIFLLVWAVREERRLDADVGHSILVRTAPVDPRDFLSGQYLQLRYEFSNPWRFFPSATTPPAGTPVWVVLRPDGVFHVAQNAELQLSPSALPPGTVALRGAVNGSWIEFGVEKYYVPQGTPTPEQRDITVRLRVGSDGRARIEQVFVKGQPWP